MVSAVQTSTLKWGQAGSACGVKEANGLKIKLSKSSWPGALLCGPPSIMPRRRWNLMPEGHRAANNEGTRV